MRFNKINNLTGWIVWAIASAVYTTTAEAGGSLWDCGEFISSCFKVQIPHPPGAPMFVLLGRLFIVAFGNDPLSAAKAVNLMSALASSFTILFLFWTITHFARKIYHKTSAELNSDQIFSVMAAGVVGALAYTFSDSFWFSAVEGEVYALSSFFTALVFWMMLKWEHAADTEGADKWIILIFFMMGLSIGVHLLNLLTIPAIVMIYYFKRYRVTAWGTFWAFILGCAITGITQKFVIQYTVKGAGHFDIFFVNTLGLPFFSGFAFYFLLLAGLIWYGIRIASAGNISSVKFSIWLFLLIFTVAFPMIGSGSPAGLAIKTILAGGAAYAITSIGYDTIKRNPYFLKLAMWCFGFMLIGYSTYVTTMIRSNANPSVDMYNVDNPMSLVGYLGREQYGDFPLIYGQVFTASPIDYEEGDTKYVKGANKYIEAGKDAKPTFASEDKMLLPRVWDASNDQGHADFYKRWLNLEEGEKPNQLDNINWAISYQIGWMYLRYFGWNFIGKQNDVQGFGNVRDGNTISGIKPVDNLLLGNQDKLPQTLRENKANNKLFALPLILGLLGMLFQIKKDDRDFLVSFLLFFFTGLAIVFYLNQAGNQPRERDYAYVGSFYAFAIWIGLGVMQVKEWLQKIVAPNLSNIAAGLICLIAVPLLMADQGWDDHDRSKKTLARDLARNYLESCAPNAILFSYGDNDTYPLWYAQEVEGIRRDVRVINYSLLGIDWYINQLRYKVNDSDPIDVIWGPEKIEGGKRDYIRFYEESGFDQSRYVDLYSLMKDFVGSDDQKNQLPLQDGSFMNYLPVKKVSIPVDINAVKANNTVIKTDSVLTEVRFEIGKNLLMKNDMAVLNIIAANKWKRPIYFTSPGSQGLGFDQYLRSDGMSYRLLPIKMESESAVNTDRAKDIMLTKFTFGNAQTKGVYFDEENRRHLISIRQAYADAAMTLVQKGKNEEAKALLQKVDKGMLEENMPYGIVSRGNQHNIISYQLAEASFKAGDTQLGNKILQKVKKDIDEQLAYYAYIGDMNQTELYQAVEDIMSNKADNLLNRQKEMFAEIRNALYIKNLLDNLVRSMAQPSPDVNIPDSGKNN
ncbi:MAG: DUF2723 domain-containing protein [Sphingobacteriales bacterium]